MSYYIAQKVSRVSQNARAKQDTPARGTWRTPKECPPLPAEKGHPYLSLTRLAIQA